MPYVRGNELPEALQREALARYVHRYTAEHIPAWVRHESYSGRRVPVQFRSDEEWLSNTDFYVTKTGKLHATRDCMSYPTWPTY